MKRPRAEDVRKGIGALWDTLQCPIWLASMEAECSTVLSGDTSVNDHHDNGDSEEHGLLPGSHSSTIEAQNGFASLMDLEDSNCYVINEGLDTSFSDTAQTSGENIHVHVGISPTVELVMKNEMAEVVEKATSRPRTRGKRRLAQLENPSSRLSLVLDNNQQQQAPKDDAEKGTVVPEKIHRKQEKCMAKVSQWLLQVPLTENLESGVNPDVPFDPERPLASPAGSSSSASTIIRQANQKKEPVKSLEDQVFGVVYSRRGKRSFSPPKHPVELFSQDPSLVEEEGNPTVAIGESSKHIPDVYVTKHNYEDDDGGVVEIQPQMTNRQSSDTGKDVSEEDRNADVNEIGKHQDRSEEPSPPDGEDQYEEGEASSLAFHSAVLRLERKSTTLTRQVMQDIDAELPKQTTEKRDTAANRRSGRRKAEPLNRKSVRGTKALVLVSAPEGEAGSEMPQSRLRSRAVPVQIKTFPSSKEVEAKVARSTRSSRSQHVAEEVQKSSPGKRLNKRAISTGGQTAKLPCPNNDNWTKPPEEARTIGSDDVTKKNGCIFDKDIGGIENIDSVAAPMTHHFSATEVITLITGSIVEVPDSVSPCEASAACFLPTVTNCISLTEAAVPSSAPESIGSANQNGALIKDAATRIECVEMEEDEDISDSEVDTEQLMKSFKVAKRKSFHLGSPKGKQSVVGSDKKILNSKMEDNCGSGTERTINPVSNTAEEESATVRSEKPPEIEKSSCGDLATSSNSPSRHTSLSGVGPRRGLRRRLVQSEEVLKLDSRSLIKSQDSAVSCLSENTDYSALSPNKAATSQSPHCSVTPETSDSVLLFSALEVFKDLPGMASRSTKCLKITENTPQPTKRKGDEITLPNKRLCISPDTDDSVELVVNTNGSITPDGLVPPVVESPNKLQASGGLKDCSPVKNITMRKKKAQRLESSSESSEEELPSLAQIFKSRRPHAVQCNLVEGTDETPKGLERLSGCEEPSLLARPLANPPVCPPSPDFVESSQASVDLFDTPAECDIAAIDTGFSMDSSPFSNDLLVTQQKLAMQQELLRLGDLIGLVTEVLHDKEEGTTTEQDLQSTGHGLPMPCAQEVKQTAEGDPAPITRRDSISLNSSAANHVESTPPCSLKPGNATETVPQSSTATRHSARLSGDPGTPSTPRSKVKTKPPLPPSPETRETTTGAQVTTRRRMSAVAHATTRKPECVLVSSGLGSSEQ
ncbi:hypothetical protein NHX12_024934, partial [Muraenolepis orangiensis]